MKALTLTQVEVKGLTGDDFIDLVLREGLYEVDLEAGCVRNSRTNRVLTTRLDPDGYLQVSLWAHGRRYTARAHRVIAISAWGVRSVRRRQVGHKNRNRSDNRFLNLWIPESVKEHNERDGTVANLVKGQQRCKTSWDPCARCGDPDGPLYHGRKTPARASGSRFGIEGKLCWHCYRALDERLRRARRKEVAQCAP